MILQDLRRGDSKYREFASKTELSDFFKFCQAKPFGELFSKIRLKLSKEFSFLRNLTKSRFAASALRPTLNLAEKNGEIHMALREERLNVLKLFSLVRYVSSLQYRNIVRKCIFNSY